MRIVTTTLTLGLIIIGCIALPVEKFYDAQEHQDWMPASNPSPVQPQGPPRSNQPTGANPVNGANPGAKPPAQSQSIQRATPVVNPAINAKPGTKPPVKSSQSIGQRIGEAYDRAKNKLFPEKYAGNPRIECGIDSPGKGRGKPIIKRCPGEDCCSAMGQCGNSETHCLRGCQSRFGMCGKQFVSPVAFMRRDSYKQRREAYATGFQGTQGLSDGTAKAIGGVVYDVKNTLLAGWQQRKYY